VIRLKPIDGRIPSGGDFSRFVRNWRGMARTLVGALWLRRRASCIKATGRSIRGLGIPADNSQIHWSGLTRREAWFRSEHAWLAAQESPVPILHRKLSPNVTKEWTKMPKSDLHTGRQKKLWQDEFRQACFSHSWQTSGEVSATAEDLWWDEVRSTGMEHLWTNYRRALRKRPGLFRGWVRYDLRLRSLPGESVVPGYWCPIDRSSDRAPVASLLFVRSD